MLRPIAPCMTPLLASLMLASGCERDKPPPPPRPSNFVPGMVPAPGAPTPTPPGVPQPVAPVPGLPGVPQPVAPAPGALVPLTPGFAPSPRVLNGTSGGARSAGTLQSDCLGYIGQEPNHTFQLTAPFPLLAIAVNAGAADTTLVIQKPDGSYLCNDDEPGPSLNPAVAVPLTPGTIKIWVGSYDAGQGHPYNLGVSQSTLAPASLPTPTGASTNTAPPAALQLDGTSSNFGTVTLSAGFTPDPHVVEGSSGGAVDASALNGAGCVGRISTQPDHLFVAQGAFPRLHLMVKGLDGNVDTTLVIRRPDGSWLCNDDEGSGGGSHLDPGVSSTFAPGTYRIWVGNYEGNQGTRYKLAFTELPSLDRGQF